MKLPKYRAWDLDDQKMWKVIGWSETIWGDCEDDYLIICDFDESPRKKETNIRHSLNFKLMQFTGLKDKTGREIYEGDIVKIAFEKDPENWSWKEEVIFHRSCFMAGDENLLFNVINGCEVIGNIYENPKLLEVE